MDSYPLHSIDKKIVETRDLYYFRNSSLERTFVIKIFFWLKSFIYRYLMRF